MQVDKLISFNVLSIMKNIQKATCIGEYNFW